jgi:hypothetical protein
LKAFYLRKWLQLRKVTSNSVLQNKRKRKWSNNQFKAPSPCKKKPLLQSKSLNPFHLNKSPLLNPSQLHSTTPKKKAKLKSTLIKPLKCLKSNPEKRRLAGRLSSRLLTRMIILRSHRRRRKR